MVYKGVAEAKKHNLDFTVGCKVIVTTTYCDQSFFPGTQLGTVIRNSGEYLGIRVEFDEPMVYDNGYIKRSHGFNWGHLALFGATAECILVAELDNRKMED